MVLFSKDYENNSFDIDMKNPLQPTVSLAGEVSGLKPTAVSDSPIDPRLFVIKRNASVTELVIKNRFFRSVYFISLNNRIFMFPMLDEYSRCDRHGKFGTFSSRLLQINV